LAGPLQSNFIHGRSASDNGLIVQEVVHYMRRSKSKTGILAVKINLKKAQDRVDWTFLQLL
jgi:hypothetical protein